MIRVSDRYEKVYLVQLAARQHRVQITGQRVTRAWDPEQGLMDRRPLQVGRAVRGFCL